MWHFARNRMIVAARANGLDAIDGPYGATSATIDGYRREAMWAATLGAVGKWAIHPSQIPIANEVFAPTERRSTKRAPPSPPYGRPKPPAPVPPRYNGMMIDAATARIFETVLERAERIAFDIATGQERVMSGFTAAVAERAATLGRADIPADVAEIARQCVLDWFAVTLAGSREPAAALVREVLLEDGAERGATVVGTGVRLPSLDAALANGVASHALDYDDVNQTMLGHPSVAILGALLALGEARGVSGADIVCAFVAGYDAQCDVAGAVGPSHYQRGFHATGTIGTIGAAAACVHGCSASTATRHRWRSAWPSRRRLA